MKSFLSKLSAIAIAFALIGCNDNDDDAAAVPLVTGPQTVMSAGFEREYYIQLPDEGGAAPYVNGDGALPLVIMYHGYSGSYEAWLGDTPYYNLAEVIGNQAILVAANGLPDSNGIRSWGAEADFEFFPDLIADLKRRGLEFNDNEIFLAGHSNGGGHAHELGCAFGDVVRGIAGAAGSLTSTDCVGSVAILHIHGSNDPLTAGVLAGNAKRYWILYNGWDLDASVLSELGPCEDYSFPGELNSPYPVLYCEHSQGHDWPDFASQTAWDLFTSISEEEPTMDFPDGGGPEGATPPSDTTLTFRIDAPANINRPLKAAATLRPLDFIDNPTCSAPDIILNYTFSVDGLIVAGQISDPITIPITYFTFSGAVEYPSEWALSITIYVEGGADGTIPSPFVDHDVIVPLSVLAPEIPQDLTDTPLVLQPAGDLCGILG